MFRFTIRDVLWTVLPAAGAIACFAAAYRFASHGITLKDSFCVGLACVALTVGVLLLGCAFWRKPCSATQKTSPDEI
jgi:hypothetical protein